MTLLKRIEERLEAMKIKAHSREAVLVNQALDDSIVTVREELAKEPSEEEVKRVCKVLDRRTFMLWPWENPKSEHFGKDYVFGFSAPKAIGKRRRITEKKAKAAIKAMRGIE